MKIDLTFSAVPGETLDLISILQKVAEIPTTKSAIEAHEAEAQLDMAYDEDKKKNLQKAINDIKGAATEKEPVPERENYTKDQVMDAAKKYNAEHGGAALARVLQRLGATCMSQLSSEKYIEFMEALNA